jgi:uncharacterized protein (TIGR02246 family)
MSLRDSAVHDCFPPPNEGGKNMTAIHKILMVASAAAFALALGGCNKGAAASDPAAVKTAIQDDEKKWNDQFKSKDLEGLLSHYADDAFFVAPGVPSANGATEIRKAYAEGLADNYFTISFASDKIDSAGDMAYARGHFSEKYQDPKSKKIVSDSGTYITVYKKQADGGWKAVEDIAVADPATRKETAPGASTPATMTSM